MYEHSRYEVSASVEGRATTLATRSSCMIPADVAAGKAAQLTALLTLSTGDGFEQFSNLAAPLQASLLEMASSLALEIQVLSELASQQGARALVGGRCACAS